MLLAVGAALVVAGARALPRGADDAGQVPPLTTAASTPAGATPSPAPSPAPAAVHAFTPTSVQLPSLGVAATVAPVSVGADGLLGVPANVRTVGWWAGGAAAGARRGTVVLVGHVDSAAQGAGAFFQLRQLEPGARIRLTGAGVATYRVVARRQYPKSALPARVVFGQGSAPRLVLVTCGGRFNAASRHYSDNIVVFAVPLR